MMLLLFDSHPNYCVHYEFREGVSLYVTPAQLWMSWGSISYYTWCDYAHESQYSKGKHGICIISEAGTGVYKQFTRTKG